MEWKQTVFRALGRCESSLRELVKDLGPESAKRGTMWNIYQMWVCEAKRQGWWEEWKEVRSRAVRTDPDCAENGA